MKALDCLDLYEDAEFYDLEFSARVLEIPFYRRRAGLSAGLVLEIACGTGRITLPIAHDGVKVTGLDVSRPMLERARLKSAAGGLSVEWIEADCRTVRLEKSFSLIFSATNAMQHLLDHESACAFLQSARRALAPKGQLILDVFNPDPTKLARPPGLRYPHKTIAVSSGENILVEAASEYHATTQILQFDLFYLSHGRLLRTKHVNMRCFFPEELLALCKYNNLEVLERFGDYDESEFSSGSPKQLLVCRNADDRPAP